MHLIDGTLDGKSKKMFYQSFGITPSRKLLFLASDNSPMSIFPSLRRHTFVVMSKQHVQQTLM